MEALQRGAVQMLAPSVSKFGPLGVREFELFDLPYLIPDAETVDRVTDGEIGGICSPSSSRKVSRDWRTGTTASSNSPPTGRCASRRISAG